jgi:hypothetical protein
VQLTDICSSNGRPILNFRASLWKHLDTSRDKLSINLFWPKKIEDLEDEDYDEEANVFPYDPMKPLLNFTNLRSLTLGGMERSYQRIIWRTVFQNPQLNDLTLEMALSPVIIREALPKCMSVTKGYIFPVPIPKWASITYIGHHGEGILHDEFGDGEYLDSKAMELAHENTFGRDVSELHLLAISKLTLMGFVIDAGPFFRWFDGNKLRTIVLRDNCFDAGFVLPPAMKGKTQVLLGGGLVEQQKFMGRVIKPGQAKIVTLSKGKVVDEEAVELVRKPHQAVQLKKKFSGILRKFQGQGKGSEKE